MAEHDPWARGHVPFMRELGDHPVRRHPVAWAVYSELVYRARYSPRSPDLQPAPGGRHVRLDIAQAVCGVRDLAAFFAVGEKAIRNALDLLAGWDLIARDATHRGSVVTLRGYAEFWARNGDEGHTEGRTEGTARAP